MQLFFFLNEYSRCSFWEVSLEMFCIVVINKQKYCFERKNWIVMKAKCFLSSIISRKRIRELKISIKHARNQQKVMLILVVFLERCPFRISHRIVLSKKVSLKISQIPQVNTCVGVSFDRRSHWRCSVVNGVLINFANFTGKHLCWSVFNKVCEKLC